MNFASTMSRRSVLTGLAASASGSLLGGAARAAIGPSGSVCSNLPQLHAAIATPQRAISLRQLSADLAAGRPAGLDRLTRLDGYIIDSTNRDIILWGLSETDQPNLYIEDFVVALRAAFGRYGVTRNGITYITNPVISIDPALIDAQISKVNLRTAEGQSRFREICATPQTVRVEGMPRNTRLAKILVDADYRMKMVGLGTVTLPIQAPFPPHREVSVQKWKETVDRGQKSDGRKNTRFWFQSGRFSHQADEGGHTVFLDRAQVVLNDEDRRATSKGFAATGQVDPITRNWCCAWSARMDDVYKAEAIWRDMHNIFRHFAITRVIKDLDAFGRADFDAQFLLERYEIPNVPVVATLPGLGGFELYVPPGVNPRTVLAATYHICGGVSVGFAQPVERLPIEPVTVSATRNVLPSRPAINQMSWTINSGASHPGTSSNAAPGTRFKNIEFQ